MAKHRGEVVEQVIRGSGFSMTKLAKRLGISRNTLYNRFGEAELSYEFVKRVGNILHYDFTIEFPEIKEEANEAEEESTNYLDQHTVELLKIKKKYTKLLERYNELLSILVKLANDNELKSIKKEILHFIDNNEL